MIPIPRCSHAVVNYMAVKQICMFWKYSLTSLRKLIVVHWTVWTAFSGPTDFNTWACCCGFGFCYDCRPSYFLLHCKISRSHAFWFVLLSVCFLVLCLTWVQSFNQSPYVVGLYYSSLGLDTDYFVTASYSSSIVYVTTKNKQITQWNTIHSIACI